MPLLPARSSCCSAVAELGPGAGVPVQLGVSRAQWCSRSRRALPLPSSAVTRWWRPKASASVDGSTPGALWKVSTEPGTTGRRGRQGWGKDRQAFPTGMAGESWDCHLWHMAGDKVMVQTEALGLAQEVCVSGSISITFPLQMRKRGSSVNG